MEKSFPLDELIDTEELRSIQDSFARAADISSVILSPEGEPLTRFINPTDFYSLIQSTGKGKERSFRSFMEMGKIALGSEEQKIFYCFAHCGHFVAPIMINGEHKGTMFAGQFTPEKFSPEQLRDLEEIAHDIDLDPGLLVKEAKKMRVIGEDVILNHSDLLFKVVESIARRGAQAAELIRAKDAFQVAHDELERRVQERTTELSEANRGLELEVAERKAVENTLRENEDRFRMMFENMSNAVAVYDAVDEGKDFIFKDFNKAGEKIDNIEKKDLIGKNVLNMFPGVVDHGLFDVFQRVWRTGKPEHHPVFFYKDERIAGWRKNYVYKLPSAEIVAIYEDITEQKAAQEAIRESEERYRSLFEFGMDGILIADIETKRFEYANPAISRMLGYSTKELKGMSISNIHPKDKLEHVISEFEAQARGEKTLALDIPCLKKDGTIIYADINTTSASVDGKKCNIGLFRDNSERKAAEEVLKKKNDELEKFNKLAVGRELKMIKLKKEINTLLEKSGKKPGYKIVGESQAEVF